MTNPIRTSTVADQCPANINRNSIVTTEEISAASTYRAAIQ